MSTQQRRASADHAVARTSIRKLQHSAIALSIAALLSAPVHAQQAQPAPAEEDKAAVQLDTVVVTGVRVGEKIVMKPPERLRSGAAVSVSAPVGAGR